MWVTTVMYAKVRFNGVHLLVHHVSVNSPLMHVHGTYCAVMDRLVQ
jgi:hypothetical protein